MLQAKNPITCANCGVVDQTRRDEAGNWIIGTDERMRCTDCGDPRAKLCRLCCPTNHGTNAEAPVKRKANA